MAVLLSDSVKSYNGRGDTGPYPITFEVNLDASGNAEDIIVKRRDENGDETTITGTCTVTGKNVYTSEAYPATDKIYLIRDPNITQESRYSNFSRLPFTRFEKDLDKITFILQNLQKQIDRAIKIPITDALSGLNMPNEEERKGRFFAFDVTEGQIELREGIDATIVVSNFAKTFLDDVTAGAALTTLGVSSFIQTLLDDADAGTARATLQIAALPDHYERDQRWAAKGDSTAADRYALLSPEYMTVNINDSGYVLTAQEEIDLSAEASWDDITGTDWTVAANRAGLDFYVYACVPSSGYSPDIVLSNNSTTPTGFTASNSRKIGGFHCLCEDVGTISGHDLSDYVAGDILPASVWDLNHRPVASPEGMVWDETGGVWWDIYLASWDSGMESVNGATIVDGASSPALHWYNFAEEFAEVKKRLPTQQEFMTAALGSPQETNISGSADPGTTGGHSDTASRRIISNIGCEDMTGVMWQWGTEGGSDGLAASWAVADTAGTAGTLDNTESIGRGQHYEAPNRPLFGSDWSNGAYCGSRGSVWAYSPLSLVAGRGARGVAEPKASR